MKKRYLNMFSLISLLFSIILVSGCAASNNSSTAAPTKLPYLETVVQSGQGAIMRHDSGAQLKILPGTFSEDAKVKVAQEEAVPRPDAIQAPVWALDADQKDFKKPIELVLPIGEGQEPIPADTDAFGIYWDGKHWSRVPGTLISDGSGLRVQAEHFSLWSFGVDPHTYIDNKKTMPAILAFSAPDEAKVGESIEVDYAVANIGESDLNGYGYVSLSVAGLKESSPFNSEKINGWDGTDGNMGSVAYTAGKSIPSDIGDFALVDSNTLKAFNFVIPDTNSLHLNLTLSFYDANGQLINSTSREKIIKVVNGTGANEVSAQATGVPDRIEQVRAVGTPIAFQSNGIASEHFDETGAFTGSAGRDIAKNWGGYQVGVAARFSGVSGSGLEGTTAQRLETRGASRIGVMRQLAGTAKGEKYHVTVSAFLAPPTGNGNDKVRLGIDPNGNTDPASADIIWIESSVNSEWISLTLPEVIANAEKITIFLELKDEGEKAGATADFDGLEIQAQKANTTPDLIISDIRTEKKAPGSCEDTATTLIIEARNIGNGHAASFNTVISGATDATCGPWRVRGLDSGSVFIYSCDLTKPGDYTIRAVVDASNTVGETNENNNWMQKSFNIAPPCTPTPTMAPPTETPMPTATPAQVVATTPTVVAPTATPAAPACDIQKAPLCLGAQAAFPYLGANWTISLDGWRSDPDPEDKRWIKITAWGTITRDRKHDINKMVATLGDADFGKVMSMIVVDDHGYPHEAKSAVITGPMAVESRLLFEDIRDLYGTFTFEITQFPAPSAVNGAAIQINPIAGAKDASQLLRFAYSLDKGCCNLGLKATRGEPHLASNVSIDNGKITIPPYLDVEIASSSVSADGLLLTLDLVFKNHDYITVKPDLGAALVINGDWQYGAYLGLAEDKPVSWRETSAVWKSILETGIPPLSDQGPTPFTIRVYALAPKGSTGWSKAILYLPSAERAAKIP